VPITASKTFFFFHSLFFFFPFIFLLFFLIFTFSLPRQKKYFLFLPHIRFFFFLFNLCLVIVVCSTYQLWTKITSQPQRNFSFDQINRLCVILGLAIFCVAVLPLVFVYWCLFMCNAKWSLREKDLSQWTHLKGLTPVCFRWCRVSSSDRANRHSQPSHEHR
jgi:hypothetical protein